MLISQKTGSNHPSWKGYGKLSGRFYQRIKYRAKNSRIPFKVTIRYLWRLFIKQGGRCQLSGLKIELPKGRTKNDNRHTASLDRIDNTKGYVPGNVQWVHKDVNYLKRIYPQKYFIMLCKKIAKNN